MKFKVFFLGNYTYVRTLYMIISKKSLPFLIPVAVGIIVGVAVLLIKPSTGKK